MKMLKQDVDLEKLKNTYEQLKRNFNASIIIAMMREYGASYADIAKVVGISRQAVKMMDDRAKRDGTI